MTSRRITWVCMLLFSCSGLAAGMNLVNLATGKCLDLYAPCASGKEEDHDCPRIPFKDLTKGSNLQLYHCTAAENQQFELKADGRIRNPLTNMCLDIQAPCKDHLRTPCERIPVNEIKKRANIQLWDCHEDTGRLSNSIGNQKWTFDRGMLKNDGSGLCLGPMGGEDMANVYAATCDGDDIQFFDLLPGSIVESIQVKWLESGLHLTGFDSPFQLNFSLWGAGAPAAVGLMVAAVLGLRRRSSRSGYLMPFDHQ